MLVLTRRIGEEIVIAETIRITVLAIKKSQVRLGIGAPAAVRVDRQEVRERRLMPPGSPGPCAGRALRDMNNEEAR
jgi:carbon storage regulator